MISARFAPAVALLLALSLIPTINHSYLARVATDGRSAHSISPSLAGWSSEPTSRRDSWVKKTFDSDDWIERRYAQDGGEDVTLFVARSYDYKRLYHHPEQGVLHGIDLRDRGVVRFAERSDVPVRVLRGGQAAPGELALYSLMSAERFIENPYLFQIQTAWELMFRAREPMTLFLVHDRALPPDTPLEKTAAARVLLGAIDSFAAQKRQ